MFYLATEYFYCLYGVYTKYLSYNNYYACENKDEEKCKYSENFVVLVVN